MCKLTGIAVIIKEGLTRLFESTVHSGGHLYIQVNTYTWPTH